ncbi:Na+/H+ antiporter subunit A [Bacillus kwashiorkori]|uniref:Na+/H+ antiporter subunit A n=1 Tax=Bacillus kwashiorkori TaxID=1522318 RepID=UPI0007828C65|nr:Na+/H+ antiporter subunit A [Bacillus kwashiorkori]
MSWILISIFLPMAFCLVIPFLYKYFNKRLHTGWFVLFIPAIIFVSFLQYIPIVASGETVSYTIAWIPSLGINFTMYLDGLALLFGLLISGMGALVILYSIFYMSKTRDALHNFYIYLLLFMSAMLGLVFSDNILILYGFWELTSISSFLLIAYWFERKSSRSSALKALLITVFGGLAMFAGFIMLIIITDTYSLREMIDQVGNIQHHPLFIPAMLLILLGAFTKSAQFPFSIWLPDAMEAPTPVSAYLHSATMVKAGLYLVARFTPIFGGSGVWFWLVSGIGLVTLLYGSLRAVRQTDLKALLAYSTISQLGLIMSLLGIGSLALSSSSGENSILYVTAMLAAVFHLFNHSTFKGSLFMIVGIIDHETGTRDIRRLGGLMNLMPISFTIMTIASFSMAGLPPFNGFLSKEMFFKGVLDAAEVGILGMDFLGILFPIIAWIASVFTFIYSMILVFKTFTGKHHAERLPKKISREAPIGMLISPIILSSLIVIIFFFPNVLAAYILKPAIWAVFPTITGDLNIYIRAWHGPTIELYMTLGVIVVGTALYLATKRWNQVFKVYPEKLSLNYLYNLSIEKWEKFAIQFTNRYMTGSLRSYLIYILGFITIILAGMMWITGDIRFDFSNNANISVYDVGLVIATIMAAFAVMFTNNRITAIVALGTVGYLVVMFFVVFRAPDLALTQTVVETVTTALFLLCFYHLPKLGKRMEKITFKLTNFLIALGVGITFTILTLAINGHKLFPSIADFFEDAYTLAGAKNIVNAILVDFRGFDTMLEISVLTIAGLGVYTLIRLRVKGSESK